MRATSGGAGVHQTDSHQEQQPPGGKQQDGADVVEDDEEHEKLAKLEVTPEAAEEAVDLAIRSASLNIPGFPRVPALTNAQVLDQAGRIVGGCSWVDVGYDFEICSIKPTIGLFIGFL